MFGNLNNHPFAVEAFFESSLVLTFAVQKEQIQSLIPSSLQLDTFNNEWAFLAVAMVQTKDLRPKGFAKWFGNDFFLIGYRVFVRYTNKAGKNLRGLYILKSETDNWKMEWLGNIFTKYSYATTDIVVKKEPGTTTISSLKSDFRLQLITGEKEVELPTGSPFEDWREARRFVGPLPFTFSYDDASKQMLIIEGVRTNWHPTPVTVHSYEFSFLQTLHLKNFQLANAFEIKNVPYYWKQGVIVSWNR